MVGGRVRMRCARFDLSFILVFLGTKVVSTDSRGYTGGSYNLICSYPTDDFCDAL